MVTALNIPDFGEFEITHVVFDFNGTLAHNGVIQATTRALLYGLAQVAELHIITADTHGTLRQEIAGLPLHAAALALVIAGSEGAAREALLAADVLFPTIGDALSSLIHPCRLLATLRG